VIKKIVAFGAICAGVAFAAGCYVGWKTTMIVVDDVNKRHRKEFKEIFQIKN